MAASGVTAAAYHVTGLTCEHCVRAVTAEVTKLTGVTGVTVDLVAGGQSAVTVTSRRPLDSAAVASALDEAGGYLLAPA